MTMPHEAWHHVPPSAAPVGHSALSFVVAATVLAAAGRRQTMDDPVSLMSRLASVLQPLGLSGRAGTWLDWTTAAAQTAA